MSFQSNSAFAVTADQARQRIVAGRLAEAVGKHNNTLRSIDAWHRNVQSWADELDDVIFDLGDDEVAVETCVSRLVEVSKRMDSVLRSMRESSANRPSTADHAGSPARGREDHVDSNDVSESHLDQ